jgi:uncharacterized protein YegJ (DUF2314 family)
MGLAVLAGLAGCQTAGDDPATQGTLRYAGPKDAGDLQQARQQAQDNLDQFIQAVTNPKEGQNGFAVKKKFTNQDSADADDAAVIDAEYMWVAVTEYKGEGETPLFRGTLDNQPEILKEILSKGDEVEVTLNEVEDWVYIENGQRKGGWSIDVLAKKTSDEADAAGEEESPDDKVAPAGESR